MQNFVDYYKILQVDVEADSDVVEAAYKKLCKKYHPDVSKNGSTADKMQQINDAYSILRNASKRSEYTPIWLIKTNKSEASSDILSRYFSFLSKRDYKNAYELLYSQDKSAISFFDFTQWQESVSKLYQIIDCSIDHDNPVLIKEAGRDYIEYMLTVTERNLTSDTICEETALKRIIYEDHGWRVVLGYRDISKYIARFQCLSISLLKSEVNEKSSSVYDRKAFFKSLMKEFERSRRYNRIFSLAIINLNISDRSKLPKKRHLTQTIVDNLRMTDIVLCSNQSSFIVLFPETEIAGATTALQKIKYVVEDKFSIHGCFYSGSTQYSGQNPSQCIKEAKQVLSICIKSSNHNDQ